MTSIPVLPPTSVPKPVEAQLGPSDRPSNNVALKFGTNVAIQYEKMDQKWLEEPVKLARSAAENEI